MSGLPDAGEWADILEERRAGRPPLGAVEAMLADVALVHPAIVRALVRRTLFPQLGDTPSGHVDPETRALWQRAWLDAYPEEAPDAPPDEVL